MTALECLKILRKMVIILIVWVVLLTGFIGYKVFEEKQAALNDKISNLEMIPQENLQDFDYIEVK